MHTEVAMASGDEVFSDAGDEQAVGTVVQAAPAPLGGFDAIVSAQISAVSAGALHLSAVGGALLTPLPLPYALLEDV
jgi:hypothetical protein